MLVRDLAPPKTSAFLFGPRGTGKSTWLQAWDHGGRRYDLLDRRLALDLAKEPGRLYRELTGEKPGTWVVIDEVQKVPALLDEVHRLIEARRLRFLLSGSSARQLRRGGADLLAGRALTLSLFPFTSHELGTTYQVERALRFGTLPLPYQADDPAACLQAYAETYLQEEIKGEALTRNLGGFARFLEVAARMNGQVTNVSGLARDAQVARQTVQGYFEILVDTLLGTWLPAWKLKRATKQLAHPKFYFFDPGVVRALSQRLPYPLQTEECGALFETLVLAELRAFLSYRGLRYPLYYWCTPDQVEVDLVFETQQGYLALELKSGTRWEDRYFRGCRRLVDELGTKVRCLGVYLGDRPQHHPVGEVLPLEIFLKRLWDGDLFQ